MTNLTLEDVKARLNLSSASNVYFSYEYPKKHIRVQGDDSWMHKYEYHGRSVQFQHKSFNEFRKWEFSLSIESDYGFIQLDSQPISLNYVTDDIIQFSRNLYDYKLDDTDYNIEMRKYLRDKARPIIDALIAMGFVNETDIEDFMLLKKNKLHFNRISQEEKDAELRKKAEEERSLRLKEYILITDDSGSIESSNIQKFQSLSRSSDIVMTLGTEEFTGTNETIGYIEFIPTTFNDSIRVAFLLCESDKFAEKRLLINTINRILRFMLPIYEILRKDFAIDTETVLSIARGGNNRANNNKSYYSH